MRYQGAGGSSSQKKNTVTKIPASAPSAKHVQASAPAEPVPGMEVTSEGLTDRFQAEVVNHSGRALNLLNERGLIDPKHFDKRDAACDAVNELRNFYYNIGFAGGQSCGKSTLINALIQYPLMATCMQATTCTPVEMIYSEQIRIIARNDDTRKVVLDYPCGKASETDFRQLLQYACAQSAIGRIENLQYFTDVNVRDRVDGLKPSELDMSAQDPKHVAILMMILLTVYVNQNQKNLTDRDKEVIALRNKTLQYFGIGKAAINMSIVIQWDCPLLKTGLKIVDLPGLASNAGDLEMSDGVVMKGHTTITKEAIARTDTMVVLSDPKVTGEAKDALEEMISVLSLREAVNPGNCIVSVLNRDDTCEGEAVRQNALHSIILMLQNVGIQKSPEDIFRCSAIYGEANYLGIDLTNGRNLYCKGQETKLREKGRVREWPEEEIQRRIDKEIDDWNDDLKYEYKGSGVISLQEFFRTAFIEKGKYEKAFSAVAAMKALENNTVSELQALIDADSLFGDIDQEIADMALEKLEESAQSPINGLVAKTADLILNRRKKATVVNGLIDKSVSAYMRAFDDSLQLYIQTNLNLANRLSLSWNPFHGDEARVDSSAAENHRIYQELKQSCQTFNVDLTDANRAFADALGYCDSDIEEIYNDALDRLGRFNDSYESTVRETIAPYRKTASPETVRILDGMVPVLADFANQLMVSARTGIDNGKARFKQIEKELTDTIMQKNEEYIRVHAEYMRSRVQQTSGGILFSSHTYIPVSGSNGILARIRSTKLAESDRTTMEQEIRSTCLEEIVSPMNGWYTDAETDINNIYVELQLKIDDMFKSTKDLLRNNMAGRRERIAQLSQLKAAIEAVFDSMKDGLKEIVGEVLQQQPSGVKTDLAAGWFGLSGKAG